MAQNLVTGHNDSSVFHKIQKKFKFLAGKLHRLLITIHLMTAWKNTKFLTAKLSVISVAAAAPKHRLHPGYKFHHSKGLGNIIVCTGFQSTNLIKFCFLGSYHNDGNISGSGRFFQFFQNGISILSRKHNIKKNQLWFLLCKGFPQFLGVF